MGVEQIGVTNGSVIVSWDFTNGEDVGILLVGEKRPGVDVEIINAFQGKEAVEIYNKLMPKGRVIAEINGGDI